MQPAGLWKAVLGELELSMSHGNFVTWFKNTSLLSCTDELFVIGVPNVFIRQQIEKKYSQLIIETLSKNGASPAKIEFKTQPAKRLAQPYDDPVVLKIGRAHV